MTKFSVGGDDDGEGTSNGSAPMVPRTRPRVSRPTETQHEESDSSSSSSASSENEEEFNRSCRRRLEHCLGIPYVRPGINARRPMSSNLVSRERRVEAVLGGSRSVAATSTVAEPQQQPAVLSNNNSSRCGSGGSRSARSGLVAVTLTDPDVFDCPICYDALTIPVFQCENGHIACSSCCTKLAQKCPSCSLPIGYNRCRAIEKVLESIKTSCHNSRYGCKEIVSFSKKYDHDKTCIYAPCSCPHPGCNFMSSSKQLYLHCKSKHVGFAVQFQFNVSFSLSFTTHEIFVVLQEEKEGVLFIMNNKLEPNGNAITVSCIGPSSLNRGHCYDLKARKDGCLISFESVTENTQSRIHNPASVAFLLVPSQFFDSNGEITLDICIWRFGVCPTNIQGSAGAV